MSGTLANSLSNLRMIVVNEGLIASNDQSVRLELV